MTADTPARQCYGHFCQQQSLSYTVDLLNLGSSSKISFEFLGEAGANVTSRVINLSVLASPEKLLFHFTSLRESISYS